MLKLPALAVLLLSAATAAAAPPTEASIDRLLALTRAEKTMDAMATSIDKMMHSSIPQLFGGK